MLVAREVAGVWQGKMKNEGLDHNSDCWEFWAKVPDTRTVVLLVIKVKADSGRTKCLYLCKVTTVIDCETRAEHL